MMLRNRLFLVVCGLLLVGGGYWLWSRGTTNILAYGMILLCPLMHLFMHGGHGQHDHDQGQGNSNNQGRNEGGASCH